MRDAGSCHGFATPLSMVILCPAPGALCLQAALDPWSQAGIWLHEDIIMPSTV